MHRSRLGDSNGRTMEAAMRLARYEILKDDACYYGEIPKCRGVYAHAKTLEKCRAELAETLEEWVLFRVHRHLAVPKIDGIDLNPKAYAEANQVA